MIKVASPAIKNPNRRTLEEFHRYWAVTHGPLFCNTKHLRRYVQHLTLPEAYGGEPAPTYDGVSIFWFDDLATALNPPPDEHYPVLRKAVLDDDAQLFDRIKEWPTYHKRAGVAAEEVVIKDGPTTPTMVKTITFAARMPGLSLTEFFDHWRDVHGPMAAAIPEVRRYVQNHAIREAYALRDMTHDGWAEIWFDDLESMQRAHARPEWKALQEDGQTLFARPTGIGVARELVQKEIGVPVRRWGAADLSEDEIVERLRQQGYSRLAADPDIASKLKAADAIGTLCVWTEEHIVTIDESNIDERPDGYK